jgi:hypothetical protein
MRATLATHGTTSTLLLAFDHYIADGIASVLVLNDMLGALNGESLPQLQMPMSLEDLVTRTLDAPDSGEAAPDDPRMTVPTTLRPFDGTPQLLHRIELSSAETARLVERCRRERTTVHAAIVTAASRVRGAEFGEDFVRTFSPINIRNLIGQDENCCLSIGTGCTGMEPADGTDFWAQAREVTRRLNIARSADGVASGSALVAQLLPVDIDNLGAEQFFCNGVPFEVLVTNLGVQDLSRAGRIRPRAIWGPIVLSQVDKEYVTGIVTYEGRLRMVSCGHTHTLWFLEGVREMLTSVGR